MMNWEELKEVFNSKFNEIFDGEDYHNLSLYERRKKIFDYLCRTITFDFEELANHEKELSSQIEDVLFNGKGICNSIVYVYKLLLEMADIYSLVLFCKDENDDHTVLLVSNDDNTMSFDDPSITIYFKNNKQDSESNDRFDYDIEDALKIEQGVNDVAENKKYLVLSGDSVNYFFGKKDRKYEELKPSFIDEKSDFNKISANIKSVKKYNQEIHF